MRINSINYTPINIYKTTKQNSIYTQNQISFNGLGDFLTLQKDKMKAKKEANEIKAKGMRVLESSSEIVKQANDIQKASKEIVSQASKLDRKAYMILVEMQSVIDVLGANDGELGQYRVISQLKNGKIERVVEKYNMDNLTLSKKAIIGKDRIVLYDYKGKNKINTYYLNPKTKKSDKVLLGAQFSAVGMRADEKFVFSRYGLASFSKDYSTIHEKSESAQERYIFGKYGLKTFMQGYENQFKSILKAKDKYDFEEKTLTCYIQDFNEINKIGQISSEKYYYDTNGLYRYEAGNETIDGVSESFKEMFEYFDGFNRDGVSVAVVDYRDVENGATTWGKLIHYNSGKVKDLFENLKFEPVSANKASLNQGNKTYKTKYEF